MDSIEGWEELFGFCDKSPKVRKWCEKDIKIKIENLKKRFGSYIVDREISFQGKYTDNECDKLNMAYYSLKIMLSKIHMWKYGRVRNVEYEPKKRKKDYDIYKVWHDKTWDNDSTWSVTTAYSFKPYF